MYLSYRQWSYTHSISMQSKSGWYISGEYNVTIKEPSASSLCHYKKTNSNSYYCDEQYKNIYPCTSGITYYSWGALPIYWYISTNFSITLTYHTSFTNLHLNYFLIWYCSMLSQIEISMELNVYLLNKTLKWDPFSNIIQIRAPKAFSIEI